MNKGVIYQAIVNRKLTFFAIFLVIIAGVFSYNVIPKQEIPDVASPAALITTLNPGASSSEIEKLVTTPIEAEISVINGISKLESTSVSNLSIVTVEFESDVDTDKVFDLVRQKIDSVESELPEGALESEIDTELTDTPAVILSFSGEQYDQEQLEEYAETFQRKLRLVDGIRKTEVEGGVDKQIVVDVDFKKLDSYQLSMDDVLTVLSGQNINIPSGSIGEDETKINVKTEGLFESLSDIENTIINVSVENGSVLRIRDIADVYFERSERDIRMRHNSQDAVLVAIYLKQSQNSVEIGEKLHEEIQHLKTQIPPNLNVDEVVFQPKEVKKSINDFIISLISGVILVIIVGFIGMGWRSAMVISTALPLAIFSTFLVMYVAGIELQQISIAGLIIALGMLVDNSIVVSDSIRERLENGEERMTACIKGTKDVAGAMFASLFTVLTAFTPLLMVPGPAGEFLNTLPKVVMVSLIASYLIALLVIPMLSYLTIANEEQQKGAQKRLKLFSVFVNAHAYVSKRKWIALIVIIILFAATIGTQSLLGLSFFPKADKELLYIDITTQETNDIDSTENIVKEIEAELKTVPEVKSFTSAIGGGLPKIYLTVMRSFKSPDTAQIKLDFDITDSERFETRAQLVDYIQKKIDTNLVGVDAIVKEIENGIPGSAPIQIRVLGDDLFEIKEVASVVTNKLAEIQGAVNVTNNGEDLGYQYYIDVDTNIATQVGLSKYDIQKQIAIALNGLTSSTYRTKNDEYDLVVKSNIDSIKELETLAIKSSVTGKKIPLKQVATVELQPELAVIHKYDRQYVVEVSGYAKSGFSPVAIQDQVEMNMKDVDVGQVELDFAGEKHNIEENFGTAASFAGIAVAAMFIIMFIQFKSFIQPLIIFISIPLAMFGSFLGLLLFGLPLSFTVVLGIISLSGIVINNAIILTDCMNRELSNGKNIIEATAVSVKSRVRPILLGATTTIFGLLPLAVSGSSLFAPMAVALMFGILMSTVLTLILIPVLNEIVMIAQNKILNRRQQQKLESSNKEIGL
ncbi:efflux RND transporter permease subunit [Bacillus sp. Marseille-P3661]|uniref:efflux RND transporter permease subunit n=1 Tax=Bacillus sp. Marseille-P3661 TaxID=1936234 RepID=UPI000C838D40|nr:efflux RND transporter permease subunit [Bacillus sp. Marseille-P3661]